MTNERTIQSTTKRANTITTSDRIKRGSYLRKILTVDRTDDEVTLTVDKGFGETVTERYAAGDPIEVWY